MGIFDLFKKKEEKKQSRYSGSSAKDEKNAMKRDDLNEAVQKMPPQDETFLQGESMSLVKPDGSNVDPGDVVRTWSRINGW